MRKVYINIFNHLPETKGDRDKAERLSTGFSLSMEEGMNSPTPITNWASARIF